MCARVLLSAVLLLSAALAGAHPFHESQTEVDYRDACSCLEISVRVKPEEMEAALLQSAAPRLPLEHPQLQQQLKAYVLQRFVLTDAKSQVVELQWVGMEIDSLGAWIYLQSSRLQLPVQLRNDLLLEYEAEQVNRVMVRIEGRQQSLQFSRSSPRVQWLRKDAWAEEGISRSR